MQKLPVTGLKGVNLTADQSAIDDDELVRAKNVVFRQPGMLGLRPALSFAKDLLTASDPSTGTFTSLSGTPLEFAFVDSLGSDRALALVYLDSSGVWRLDVLPSPDSSVTVPDLGTLSTSRPQLFVYRNSVYCFTGEDYGWIITPNGFGSYATAPFAFSSSQATPLKPRFAAVCRNRMWFANLGTGYEDTVVVSDINDPTAIGSDALNMANSFGFRLSGGSVQKITAIAEVATDNSGSPAQSSIFVWTRRNVYQLLGEPLETDEVALQTAGQGFALPAGSLQINKLNVEAGCVGHGTIVTTPYGLFWAGEDDVWFMPSGSLPIRVGTKIRPALLESPAAFTWKWHAAYDGGFLKLAIFAPGQGPTEYSPCNHHWWLDLRNGPPKDAEEAVWMGPHEFVPSSTGNSAASYGTIAMHRDLGPGGDGRTYAIQPYRIYIDATHLRTGISLCTFNEGVGRDTVAPQQDYRAWQASTAYEVGDIITPQGPYVMAGNNRAPLWICTTAGTSGSTEPLWMSNETLLTKSDGSVTWTVVTFNLTDGYQPAYEPPSMWSNNEIIPEIITKEQGNGPNIELLNDGAECSYWASSDTKLTCELIPSGNFTPKTLFKQDINNLDAELANTASDLLTNPFGYRRKFSSRLFPDDSTRRSVARNAQLRIYGTAGVYVGDYNNTIYAVDLSDSDVITLTIANGWYADRRAVLAAFIAAFNATPEGSTIGMEMGNWASTQVGYPSLILNGFVTGWIWIDVEATTVTAAQAEANRRAAATIGFSVTVNTEWGDGATAVLGTTAPSLTIHGDLLLMGIKHRIDTFARPPL